MLIFHLCQLLIGSLCVQLLILVHKGGGLAEYAIALEKETALRPEEVSPADAAGLPVAGLTALQLLQLIGTKFDGTGKGANILITATSGGVGCYAVQLAKLGGHHVTATSGARNIDLVRSLGADEVLDYKTPEGNLLIYTIWCYFFYKYAPITTYLPLSVLDIFIFFL